MHRILILLVMAAFFILLWLSSAPHNAEPPFYQTLDKQPVPVYSAQQALSTFRIAPGYEVELVAAEPLVGDPVAAAWDEYGRLYVVEMRSYMPDAYGTDRGSPLGRVVRLEDTDRDGRMDTSEVFLDQLTYPRAVAVTNDGILVAEPPNLWLCELPGRDVLCTDRRRLGGYGLAATDANVEHLENKLLPGLDNWYYNSKSSRRLRIVGGELESRHSLFRGQWGMGKDNVGRLFYNHNSNLLSADFFAAEDLLKGPAFGVAAGLGDVLSAPEEVFSVRVNPGVNRAYLDNTLRPDGRLHRATSASGLTPYRGDSMPALAGDVFVAEPAANVVAQFHLREQGIALHAQHRLYDDPDWGQREFLGSTDERFRPIDVMNGPDGTLYLVDMYRGLIQDQYFLTQELREQVLQRQLDAPIGLGRIWRIKRVGAPGNRAEILADRPVVELVAALGSGNGWVRDTAQRLLLKYPGRATAALRTLAVGEHSLAAIHALWTLQGRGELDRATVLQAMACADVHRQVQALRAGAGELQQADLLRLAGQTHPGAVQMQLAFALGAHAAQPATRISLLALLQRNIDNIYIRQALVRAVRGEELAFLPELLASPLFDEAAAPATELVGQVALSAYRSARPDFSADGPAPQALGELLQIVESQRGERGWVQAAMLRGLYGATRVSGFKPAVLTAAPPIFADSSINETHPLWDARLKGRRAFTWPGDEIAAGLKPLSLAQNRLMAQGEVFYTVCAACHGWSGEGITGLGPALAGSTWVSGPPEYLGRIILQGFDSDRHGLMPPHGHLAELDDVKLAGLMLYLRRSWGNRADPVALDRVAAIRATSAGRATPWTAAELETVLVDRGYARYAGKYQVSFITMTVSVQQGELVLDVPMYGGGPLAEESEGVFVAALGGQPIRLEFEINEDGSVLALLLWRGNEKIPLKRVEQAVPDQSGEGRE